MCKGEIENDGKNPRHVWRIFQIPVREQERMAEGVGFEPTREQNPLPVFKTGALNHSATLPSSIVADTGKALIAQT
jgi:hypothetical protein